ncbi:hypothetical protein ACJX0J_020628, partial [Zea mays]
IIEIFSVRPPVDAKLKLLKEIAEEHEVDWDPSETEIEFLKRHEDLLNGPTYFNGSTLPLPKEKHDETVVASPTKLPDEDYESDTGLDKLDLLEVPKAAICPPSLIDPRYWSIYCTNMEDNPRAGGTFNFIQMESVEHLTSTPSAQSNVPDLSDEKKQIIPFASPLQFVATPLEKTD